MTGRLLLLLAIFSASLLWLVLLVALAPSGDHKLHFPSDFEHLHGLKLALNEYSSQSRAYVLLLFCSAYLFKQAFAVPGSALLNVLSGAVFGLGPGFALSSVLTAFGATCCYGLARVCGGVDVAERFFPERLATFKRNLAAADEAGRLTYFLLFLRLFPMSPNWAVNISCGILGVPVAKFFLTVLFGLMPYNFVCVQTGSLLAQVGSLEDALTWSTFAQLTAVAVVVLLPGLVVRRRKNKEDMTISSPSQPGWTL